jgi:pyruvate/2-oxoglutarate/acetoin dehydrogenase E1 component
MTVMRYQQALAAAVRDEMASDPQTIYIGEDVEQSLRYVSVGLAQEHPGRVRDMPISEAAFTGFATGAAMAGRRPIVEYQIPTLLYVAFDQIVNQAHKIRLMTGGQTQVPVTYLFPGSGARLGLAGQHSDHPYSLLAHAGIKTLVPASPQDAYSLMRAAIRDNDPVAVFAPAACLHRKGEVDSEEIGQIGRAAIVRSGTDVTVVTIGHLVWEVLAALKEGAPDVSAEVIDSRSVYPFDWELLGESIRRTGRLVVVDDANRTCGFAAEIAATAAQRHFADLRAPIIRVTRADGVVPFAVALEQSVIPSHSQIIDAVRQVMH